MTTRVLIIKTGEALYGARYQSELADNPNVNERTMRRWVAGDSEPPETVLIDLLELINARGAELRSVERLIKGSMKR